VRPRLGSAALVTALFVLLACAPGDLVLPPEPGPPADLLKVSGDEQSAAVSEEVPDPLLVKLIDEQGLGVPAGSITWVVGAGGGAVNPGTTETGSDGLAQVRWTLGSSPGVNTVSAVVSGVSVVTFTASATGNDGGGGGDGDDGGGGGGGGGGGAGVAHHLAFLVQPSDAEEGERITPAVVVALVDELGVLAPESKVKVVITLADGSDELGGKREADTKNGFAVFDDLKVEQEGDAVVLRAQVPEAPQLGSVDSRPFRVEDD
jgi:hypothetical protein